MIDSNPPIYLAVKPYLALTLCFSLPWNSTFLRYFYFATVATLLQYLLLFQI